MSGFTFGNTGGGEISGTSASSTGGLFSTSAAPATSSVFGQSMPATSNSAGVTFGGSAGSGATPMFGSGNTGASQPTLSFGMNAGSKPGSAASTPSLFGANASTGSAPAGGLFGLQASDTISTGTSGGMFGSAGTSSTSGRGDFSFGGAKKDEVSTPTTNQSKPATAQTGLFPSVSNTGNNLFGISTQSTSISTPAALTTPAAPKFSFNNSTTPAGPPPTENGQAKPFFGSTPDAQQPLFGAKPADSSQQKASSLFSGLNSGAMKGTPGGLFGKPSSSPASTGAAFASTTAAAQEAPKPTFSFPSTATAPGASTSTTTATQATTSLPGSATTSAAAAAASNMFGNLSKGTTTTTTTTAPATSTTSSAPTTKPSFGGLGNPPANSSATSSTNVQATSNLFGQPGANSTTKPPFTSGMAAPAITSAQAAGASQHLGASTTGPTPQQSRLKNKTMDEIITRWASDLLKYQKEFHEQATKVAAWDRLLVENGEKIQTLADSTHEAERATREIESQLSTVEGQQAELTSWLDRYEADVDEMFSRQVGPGETLQGPDQERERTYKIAEKLTDRLDEMGKNITSMIEAINDASTNVSKNAKTDDPLSHIVRVLNSHLTQLQWIDQNTEILQAKVAAAQKMGQNMSSNGYSGLGNDAAESFYRSYTSRR